MTQSLKRSGASENNKSTTSTWWSQIIAPTLQAKILRGTYNTVTTRKETWFEGWNTPNYHKRRKAGELLPHTPFKQFSLNGNAEWVADFTYIPIAGSSTVYHWWNEGDRALDALYLTTEDLLSYSDQMNDLYVQAAAAKIYMSGYDLLTFVGEFKETVQLFRNAAHKVATLPRPKDWRKTMDHWLEWRYGWRMVYYDILNIIDAFNNFDDKRTRHSERCGNTHTTYNVDVTVIPGGYTCTESFTQTIRDKVIIGLRGAVDADISIPKVMTNPVVTAWELTRFSFVIDWFLTVGKAIAATFLAIESRDYAASKGIQVEIHRTAEKTADWNELYLSGDAYWSVADYGKMQMRVPCKVPCLPRTNVRLDGFKILDIMALFTERNRR